MELFFRYLGSQPQLFGSVLLFPFHCITQSSFCIVSNNSPWNQILAQVENGKDLCQCSLFHLFKKKIGPSLYRLLEKMNTFLYLGRWTCQYSGVFLKKKRNAYINLTPCVIISHHFQLLRVLSPTPEDLHWTDIGTDSDYISVNLGFPLPAS